ncbi:Uncharacterized protein AArcCO_0264 [Halalkaliarchaeum sp. AArc-CO]|uniref:hypothetical protein n=1 Tax=unclassified Halalkaliarchaeum TaxID=2678344 RepID=UPI00217CE492|nr:MULTISPECIES: hypothetical protein [unclassified Halalkaliarchaeum]MDR5673127.1 hypothetical protein [Halalkaliarchaeum sp. AArc-GB]UWG49591.1 Uncharacterized protein AArcCO_0264 [Halalkaliarchaeum sp. AArc-CO]
MPDTKTGRERKGRNKRRQLERRLAERELRADEEPPAMRLEEIDSEYLVDPSDLEEFDGTDSFDWIDG